MIIKENTDEIENYLSDASNYKGFCDKVFIPEIEDELISTIKECNNSNTRITITGNGTGLTGAKVPEGGILISTEKLNKIISIDTVGKKAVVQGGVLLQYFQDETEKLNLLYPPDPTERNCFIGSTIATNSSGARTYKYGPTRNYVNRLRIVLPDGEVLSLKHGECIADEYELSLTSESGKSYSLKIPEIKMPATKNAAGYYCRSGMDAIDLFIGSEGTLGIITETELKLIDLPGEILSAVLFFNSEDGAFSFLSAVKINKTVQPRSLEFFDKFALQFLKKSFTKIPDSAQAAIWFEQEIDKSFNGIEAEWFNFLDQSNADIENSWFAFDEKNLEEFKDFRHAISWKVNEFITQHGFRKVGTDTAVPDNHFHEFYSFAKNIVEKENINYVAYGHFGNSHLHLNMLPENDEQFIKAKALYYEICKEAVRLDGTVSAEHGIGKMKREYFKLMYNQDEILQMAQLKKTLDPNLILGIGNIFDENIFKMI
ncbi:MAG: FAD-binding oxidoreductase [Melioribacteraceae bacterium]|nr:FAD-binding oxidoreductase [Melioribacteraceae bacterium]